LDLEKKNKALSKKAIRYTGKLGRQLANTRREGEIAGKDKAIKESVCR